MLFLYWGPALLKHLQLFEVVEQSQVAEDVDELQSARLGLGAEYLVAADLCFAGHRCSLAAAGMPYDLIADVGGRLVRIQVKATGGLRRCNRGRSQKGGKSRIQNRYVFHGRRKDHSSYSGDADVFAFVAVDLRLVLYVKVSEASRDYEISPGLLTEDYCSLSRVQALK